ncbi:MAG: efflux RND transporter periplasmic adaptor subunit [Proteobacteria bacterium]|nr:efflux RND transporter periplasmic adaptor subunit [Pseudomonadota bacterium]
MLTQRLTAPLLSLFLSGIYLSGCSKTPEVKAVRAVKGSVESTVSSVNAGTVRAEQVAELAFGAVGRVKKLHVKLGDRVRAGDVLAELENEDLIASYETAQAEQKRRLALHAQNLLSQAQVDEIRRLVDGARVAYEKSFIKAPYDGMIGELNLEVGQLSQITAVVPLALIRIVDLNPRYIRAEIDEADLGRITMGLPARAKILAVRREPFPAKIRKVVPFVNSIREQDRTAQIELTVDSGGVLLPAGASADIEIIVETHNDVVAVPSRTVLGRGANRFVYVIEDTRLKKVPVKVGLYNYERTEILSGIAAGATVAQPTDILEFKEGMKVKPEILPWP